MDPRERGGMRVILEDEVQEMEEAGEISEVPGKETAEAIEPRAGGSGARKETSGEEVPEVQEVEARMESGSEVQELVSAIRELTEVVREGFREVREANRLQRLVNEDLIEKIRNKNWRKYERMARREE